MDTWGGPGGIESTTLWINKHYFLLPFIRSLYYEKDVQSASILIILYTEEPMQCNTQCLNIIAETINIYYLGCLIITKNSKDKITYERKEEKFEKLK